MVTSPFDPGDWMIVDLTLMLAEELPAAWAKHVPYQQKTFNYFTDRDDQVAPLKSEVGPYQTRCCCSMSTRALTWTRRRTSSRSRVRVSRTQQTSAA